MKRKALKILVFTGVSIALLVAFIYVQKLSVNAVVRDVSVNIIVDAENQFVTEEEILTTIIEKGIRTTGMKKSEVNLHQLEQLLTQNSAIEDAAVYFTNDGILKINIVQRKPILRVFDNKSNSFYIDDKGKSMPTNPHYTARILVATGNISALDSLNRNEKDLKTYQHLYQLALTIKEDSLLQALIEQVYIKQDNEVELITKIGPEYVILGDMENLQDKFERLKLFYQQGLPANGWNKYATINLKINNQVICTKN